VPVAAGERVAMIDALRGFALFGILLANLMGFVVGPAPESMRLVHFGASLSGPVEFGLEWLVVGKFYSLFSLLFGIGFAIQLERLEARGEGVARYVRRLLVLFGFGVAHSSWCGLATFSRFTPWSVLRCCCSGVRRTGRC
jgi:uncharacterized protein